MQMQPDDVLAVDLGGTRMRAARVSGEGEVSSRKARETPVQERDLNSLFELVGEVDTRDLSRAVVAVPGRVDYRLGTLEHAPNLPERWKEVLREDYLSARLGLEVALANDADAAAVGEAYFGAGRHHEDMVYMTVSTGIGGGVVLGGKLMRGRRSSSEIGHTVVDRLALFAGAPAALEELGSGSALESSAKVVGLPADGRRVVDLAREGDPRAQRIWRELVDVLVVGAANLAHLFTPQVIVLGGGVGLNGDLLLEPINRHLVDHGPRSLPEPVCVVTSELGDNAGLAGAAAWRRALGRVAEARPSYSGPLDVRNGIAS